MSTSIDKDTIRSAFDDVRDDSSPTTWYDYSCYCWWTQITARPVHLASSTNSL